MSGQRVIESEYLYLVVRSGEQDRKQEAEYLKLMITIQSKGGFMSEGRGGFSQLPKMSAEKTFLGFKK